MAKKKQLPVNVVQNSKNRKLSALKPTYNVVTTYTEVGPTCPHKCWFHPTGEYLEQAKALGLKLCYTKKGPTNFLVSAKAFQDADFTKLGIDDVARVFDGILTMHKYRRKHVDLIRWQTGGDLLHPWTGVIWDEFVDLILDVAAFSRPLGIPTIGFTATWRDPKVQRLKGFFHASVQTPDDAAHAIDLGWSVAYAVLEPLVPHAIKTIKELPTPLPVVYCPEQSGRAESCADCGLCCVVDPAAITPHPLEPKYMLYRRKVGEYLIPMNVVFKNH
jgi:hypothetical protein